MGLGESHMGRLLISGWPHRFRRSSTRQVRWYDRAVLVQFVADPLRIFLRKALLAADPHAHAGVCGVFHVEPRVLCGFE